MHVPNEIACALIRVVRERLYFVRPCRSALGSSAPMPRFLQWDWSSFFFEWLQMQTVYLTVPILARYSRSATMGLRVKYEKDDEA